MNKRKTLMFAALGVSILAACYCLLWIISSSRLAADACSGYSLFHEVSRCRQPHLAMVLTLLFVPIGVVFGFKAFRE